MFLRKMSILFLMLGITSLSMATTLSTPRDLPQILATKTLVVAIPKESPPLFFRAAPKGKQTGLSVEIASAIAKSLGVSVVFNREAKTYNDAVNLVAQHEADVVICDLSKILMRGKSILYTQTYAKLSQTLLINRAWLSKQHKNPLATFDLLKAADVPTFHVGVLSGSAYIDYAHDLLPHAKISTFSDWPLMLKKLQAGEVDAVFYDDFEIKKVLIEKPIYSLKFKAILFKDQYDYLAFAVPTDHRLLRDYLNLYLELSPPPRTTDDFLRLAKAQGVLRPVSSS